MYVPKVPRRSDFCGSPPCPLCFDWVEPVPPEEVKKSDPLEAPVGYRIDGMRKMTEEILGKDAEPTNEQKAQLYQGAETVHLRNLEKQKLTPEQVRDDLINEGWIAKGVNKFLEQRRIAANTAKPLNIVTCDSIADEKAAKEAEEKEKKKEKVVEKERAPVYENPYASEEAPVDYDLLRREKSEQARRLSRQREIDSYRARLAAEKARWEDLQYRK